MNKPMLDLSQICPECRALINELVDHRMSFSKKHDFMKRISRCRREKGCYICIELVKSFFHVRKKVQLLKSNVTAPDWLMQKIIEKIQ